MGPRLLCIDSQKKSSRSVCASTEGHAGNGASRALYGALTMLSWWILTPHRTHRDMLYNLGYRNDGHYAVVFIPATLGTSPAFPVLYSRDEQGCTPSRASCGSDTKKPSSGAEICCPTKTCASAACLLVYLAGYALNRFLACRPVGWCGSRVRCSGRRGGHRLKAQLSGVRWMSTQSIGLLIALAY